MERSITPHGGKLVNRMLEGEAKDQALAKAKRLPVIRIDREIVVALEMIATGVLSPNEGFMGQEDYESVLYKGRLANGLPWTLPPTFAPIGGENAKVTEGLKPGEKVALVDAEGDTVAILNLTEKFKYDKDERARCLFGATDRSHPGVDNVYRNMGDVCLAGPIDMLKRTHWGAFEPYRLEPKDTWQIFKERGWKTVVAFQTANPIHRGHEYLQKCALEILDGLFIHPIVETTRKAYFRNEFRIKAYQAALDSYYPKDRVVLAPLRVTMNYAGPKEAILHAIIRRNFGCTHFIVGRDHAGFRNFYDPYASQRIFDDYDEEALGIKPIFFKEAFFCTRCGNMGTEKTCPHGEEFHIGMSGTGIQDILRYGFIPPKEVMRPEVTQIAMQGIQPKGVDPEAGMATQPPGNTVAGLFPFYLKYHKLGGYPREKPLEKKELTVRDLEMALSEARENATRIYDEIYEEMAHYFDINRNIADRQKAETLLGAIKRQLELIEALEEKLKSAEETVRDPFMYQDKAEVERELKVSKAILEDLTNPTQAAEKPEKFKERVWNPMQYRDYCI